MFDRIAVNPHVHFGKPCIAGTRIPVQNILELVEEGIPFAKIIQEYYPDINTQDVHACLRYAIALVAAEDAFIVVEPTGYRFRRIQRLKD